MKNVIMKLTALRFAAASLVIFAMGVAHAGDTYFLDSLLGDDSYTGTSATFQGGEPPVGPWKSLKQVFSYSRSPGYSSGSQVLFHRGQEFLGDDAHRNALLGEFGSSGAPGEPIVFDAYGEISYDASGRENKPIIRLQVSKTGDILQSSRTLPLGWVPTGLAGVWKANQTVKQIQNLWEDEIALREAPSLSCLQDSACQQGHWFFDDSLTYNDLYYRPTDGADPNIRPIPVYIGFHGTMDFFNRSYLTFRNLEFRTGRKPIRVRARTAEVTDILVENCVFHSTETGLFLSAWDYAMRRIRFLNNVSRNVLMTFRFEGDPRNPPNGLDNLYEAEVAYNQAYDCNATGAWDYHSDREAISIQNMNDSRVHHNTVAGGRCGAIGFYGGPVNTFKNNHFEYNYVNNMHGDGSWTATGIAGGGGGISRDTCFGNIIRYNVFANMDRGIHTALCHVTSEAPVEVSNNVLYGNAINVLLRWGLGDRIFRNNIFGPLQASTKEPVPAHIVHEGGTTAKFTFDHNLYYPDGPALFGIKTCETQDRGPCLNRDSSRFTNFSGWQAFGMDTVGSRVADPLLTNPVGGEFRLQANSSGIDAGVGLGATADIDGKSIVGRADIGAYEFGTIANGDDLIFGTVSGAYVDTHRSDGGYQSVTEVPFSGQNKSRAEHVWMFDINGGGNLSMNVIAYHTNASIGNGDDFLFSYSINGSSYQPMFLVTKTIDDGTVQSFNLPVGSTGILSVKAADTVRSINNEPLDTLFVDQLYIKAD
jgi:hypothetical protein